MPSKRRPEEFVSLNGKTAFILFILTRCKRYKGRVYHFDMNTNFYFFQYKNSEVIFRITSRYERNHIIEMLEEMQTMKYIDFRLYEGEPIASIRIRRKGMEYCDTLCALETI